jgi:hypothetical protein
MRKARHRRAPRPQAFPFAAYFTLALAAIVAGLLIAHWDNTARTLIDTDDAMRLVQMRDWFAGQGWFDLAQKRMALPYESHWSRLLDAALAGVFLFFSAFTDHALAERLLRVIWPLVLIAPALAGVLRHRLAARGTRSRLAHGCCSRSRAFPPISNSPPGASIIIMCRSR